MAPMPSLKAVSGPLGEVQGRILLGLARDTVRQGPDQPRPPDLDLESLPAELRVPRATFVTLPAC